MSSDKLFDIIFNMKLAMKQMNKCAASAEKASNKEKLLIKKALEKGNVEAARIYSENAIRKRNEYLSYLRLASRLDAAVSRIQTADQMRLATKTLKKSAEGLSSVMNSMDPMKLAKVMDEFERQVGTLDVNVGTMDAAFDSINAGTVPVKDVDLLMEQIAADNNLDISAQMGCVPGHKMPQSVGEKTTEGEAQDALMMEIDERLQRLTGSRV